MPKDGLQVRYDSFNLDSFMDYPSGMKDHSVSSKVGTSAEKDKNYLFIIMTCCVLPNYFSFVLPTPSFSPYIR